MPVELSPGALASALARLGEHDLDAPRDVEGALEWIAGWEDREAPVVISRYELQVFLWYQLPRKWLISLDEKRAVVARLARFLELAGEGAAAYAPICRSAPTARLLEEWEGEGADAGPAARGEPRGIRDRAPPTPKRSSGAP